MPFKVTINHWHAVANWTWNAGDDVCGICRAPFDGNPPEAAFPGDDAPVVWGVCSHAFHIQCINKWLSSQPEQKCPFCRRPWEFKQAEALAPPFVPTAEYPYPPGHPRYGTAVVRISRIPNRPLPPPPPPEQIVAETNATLPPEQRAQALRADEQLAAARRRWEEAITRLTPPE